MPFLAGFDARWHDAADYLAALDTDLWEGRRLDKVPDLLSPKMTSHGGTGALYGPEDVGADLVARAAAFPDQKMISEELLWTPVGQTAFYAAQRFHFAARHDGPGLYGPPTGKPVSCTVMAERHCVAGQLREEWVLRDEAAILRQIGVSVEDGARWRMADPSQCPEGWKGYEDRGATDTWGNALADALYRVMAGELSALSKAYDPGAELFLPGGEIGSGPREAEAFWIALRASFPSAAFRVDHRMGEDAPLSSPRAALRWSLVGKHDGHGAFGAPTGADVQVMGLTQAEFGPNGLRREWTLYDVPGVWAQILRSKG